MDNKKGEKVRKRIKCETCKGRGTVPIPGFRSVETCKICLGKGFMYKIE